MKSLGKRFQRMGKSNLCTLMPLQIMPVALNSLKKIVTLLDTYYNVHSVQFSSVSQSCLTLRDRKSTRLNSSHSGQSRMPSSA